MFDVLNNKIIIVEPSFKKLLLSFRSEYPDCNFKMISKDELIKRSDFYTDEKADILLYRKGYSFDNIDEIIKSLHFIKKGISKKIDDLVEIKDYLIKEQVLITDDAFKTMLKKSEVVVINYSKEDKELNLIFNEFNIKPTYYDFDLPFNDLTYYEFEKFDEEILYLFCEIHRLLKNGEDASKIKVVAPADYKTDLKKYERFYNIKFNIESDIKLYNSTDYLLFEDYIKNIISEEAFDLVYEKILDKESFDKLFSKYLKIKDNFKENEIEEYISYCSKKINTSSTVYENGIDICSLDDVKEDDIVFLVGFSLNEYPHTSKDVDYLSDIEKEKLGLSTTLDKRKYEILKIENKLKRIKNIYISYCKKKDKAELYISSLAKKMNMKKIKYDFEDVIYSFSHFKFLMGKYKDDNRLYSFKSPFLNSCDDDSISYLSYSNSFKGLDSLKLDKLRLSASSLKDFYLCKFKYYLNHILKVDPFQKNIYSEIGNLCHKILENEIKKTPYSWDNLLDEFNFNHKDKILVQCLKKQIDELVIDFNNFLNNATFNTFESETDEYSINISSTSKLVGRMDMIASNENNYIIIDFKTSDKDFFSADKVPLGLSLQLPIYALILQGSDNQYKNKNLVGLYIKNIINRDFLKGDKKYLLLKGLTRLKDEVDKINENEVFIGKDKKSHNWDYDSVVEETIKLIKNAEIEIIDKNFEINPKMVNGSDISCPDCPFGDICFKTYKNYQYLQLVYDDNEDE